MPHPTSLLADLNALGIGPNRPLLVHSSLRALGHVEGGAEGIIRTLLDAVGPHGSLLFPNLNIPHEFSAKNPPRFDLQRDSIRARLGVLAEVFKQYYAKEFSRHPTHAMMGIGPHCSALFTAHEQAGQPCGPGTPWWRLAEADGQILLLGVTQQSNTSIHGPEEQFTSYQLGEAMIEGVVIDRGTEIKIPSRLHRWGNASDFSRINPSLERAGGLRRGKIGEADCALVDARIFQNEVSARLKSDPRFLLK